MTPYYDDGRVAIHCGDALEMLWTLPDESVQCCITSPPYWGLRDYGTGTWEGGDSGCDHKTGRFDRGGLSVKQKSNYGSGGDESSIQYPRCGARRIDQQLGLERTPDEYVAKMVEVFREVRRVLRSDGVMFLNLGDSYASGKGTCHNPGGNTSSLNVHLKAANVHPLDRGNKSTLEAQGLKPKDLVGIPWRVAFALQADGWWLRQDIIWAKSNPMPESVTDRCTKAHEYVFLLAKSARYYFDAEAIKEPCGPRENRNGFRGENDGPSHYVNQPALPGNGERFEKVRKPAGWDTGQRSHGSIHQDGRAPEVKYGNIDATKRNRRSVWTVPTFAFSEAHFATFPPDLIKPMVLAGTPPKCCGVCGAPWERETETSQAKIGSSPMGNRRSDAKRTKDGGIIERTDVPQFRTRKTVETLGWRPTCEHNDDTGRSVVLDPFMGSGTVALVAKELGRKCVGIDLRAEYLDMAIKRVQQEVLAL